MNTQANEAVRLVVWDLDETFWRGTLSEGGITEYVQAHHDVVIELARRGILSSICSKNDRQAVMEILLEKGIADYFVFPSISWDAKGPRMAQLIDDVQLRPETAMLIDDNHLNRAEVQSMVPGVQVEDETFIARLLTDPRFKGKDDAGLTRLEQYRRLEQKTRDQSANPHGHHDFLRQCNIHVFVEREVEANIDRAIELINRTNQLNFTKVRLPEDLLAARAELRELLRSPTAEAGLVRAADRYGDYGFVGFYLLDRSVNRLLHYCWSCRTLGMSVEKWMHERLGRPTLTPIGETATHLDDELCVDWIVEASDADGLASATQRPAAAEARFRSVFLRGGCELQAMSQFLSGVAGAVHEELIVVRNGIPVRSDHTVFLEYALGEPFAFPAAALATLGYEARDFESALRTNRDFDAYAFTFHTDIGHPLYELDGGAKVPFEVPGWDNSFDVRTIPETFERNPTVAEALRHLALRCTAFASFDPAAFTQRVRTILSHVPEGRLVFVVLPPTRHINKAGQEIIAHHWRRHGELMEQIAQGDDRVHLLHTDEFILSPAENVDGHHVTKEVTHRMFERIVEIASLATAA